MWISGNQILLVALSTLHACHAYTHKSFRECGVDFNGKPNARSLKYVMGNALVEEVDCVGPDGVPYPKAEIEALIPKINAKMYEFPRTRSGRTMFNTAGEAPKEVTERLLKAYAVSQNSEDIKGLRETVMEHKRAKRQADATTPATTAGTSTVSSEDTSSTDNKETSTSEEPSSCPSSTPSRLCKTSFNTTAPMYGVSLTTGGVVTIVQKFPDLLQQVIFETCEKSQCDLIHGECVQTYTPYLFLVIPLGPVTLTGQDYVMVESGCTCRPKYSTDTAPNPLDVIPKFKTK